MPRITLEMAKILFSYDPETGVILRKYKRIIKVAGYINGRGYREIEVDGRVYQATHIIWLLTYGRWPRPKMEIDHIDLSKANNWLTNLREATHGQNQANSRAYKNNSTGLKGAGKPDRKNGKYYPYIQHNKQKIRLGGFRTAEEAHAAYMTAAQKYHKEFARA